MIKHWKRFPRKVAGSLEVFRHCVDIAFGGAVLLQLMVGLVGLRDVFQLKQCCDSIMCQKAAVKYITCFFHLCTVKLESCGTLTKSSYIHQVPVL